MTKTKKIKWSLLEDTHDEQEAYEESKKELLETIHKFPSLKGKEIELWGNVIYYDETDVEECCIDKQELQKIIAVYLENMGEDITATKKTKEFRVYKDDGSKISKQEHLDKLFFAKQLFEDLKERLKQ